MIKTEYKDELWTGEDIVVNDYITIKQPTVGEILHYKAKSDEARETYQDGEFGYYKWISVFTSTPADYDVQLNDEGIRYEDIDKMDFFFSLVSTFKLDASVTYPIFGDLDFTKFQRYTYTDNNQVFYMDDMGHKIDRALYTHILTIIRDMHNISVNKTKWGNEMSRKMHMEYEKKRASRHHHEKVSPILPPIISMLINYPGFKYNREQSMQLNIYFLYDCFKQIIHSQQVDHLMTGVYVGLIDTKKMNLDEQLNMLRKDF